MYKEASQKIKDVKFQIFVIQQQRQNPKVKQKIVLLLDQKNLS